VRVRLGTGPRAQVLRQGFFICLVSQAPPVCPKLSGSGQPKSRGFHLSKGSSFHFHRACTSLRSALHLLAFPSNGVPERGPAEEVS
jgi:hypothetical protein